MAGMVTPDITPKSSSESPLPALNLSTAVSKEDSGAFSHAAEPSAAGPARDDATVDTAPLKAFIEEKFRGARLMEEHQVCVCVCVCVCVRACVRACVLARAHVCIYCVCIFECVCACACMCTSRCCMFILVSQASRIFLELACVW